MDATVSMLGISWWKSFGLRESRGFDAKAGQKTGTSANGGKPTCWSDSTLCSLEWRQRGSIAEDNKIPEVAQSKTVEA